MTNATQVLRDESDNVVMRNLGRMDYETVWNAMRSFNSTRTPETGDEIWLVEHEPVYTLGLNCKKANIVEPNDIPVVKTDRGGQITYHGPGQVVVYVLLDLKRRGLGVKQLVHAMEQAVIDLLGDYQVEASRRTDAPGVYVEGAKIAALGLRVKQGSSYHGIALNVAMDLSPFSRIDPCGYPGLATTELKDLGISLDVFDAGERLVSHLAPILGYNGARFNQSQPEGLAHA
ncbi:MAG: lipoyl(octanoyl) transferase LipB [Acidiferrobacterales bacterium]|nr:lipoyl(octanoyl) transferase LipB [Acidiferrobacterales bacterium]